MYGSFFLAFSLFLTYTVSVFVFDLFHGDPVKKAISCGIVLSITEISWAFYAYRKMMKKVKEEALNPLAPKNNQMM